MKWRHMESKERREQEKQQAASVASAVASSVNKAASPATSITSTSSVASGIAVSAPGPSSMPRFPPFLHHAVPPGSLHGRFDFQNDLVYFPDKSTKYRQQTHPALLSIAGQTSYCLCLC